MVRTGCHYFNGLVCLFSCVSVCVTLDVFTDCESCTKPISTHPGIYGSGRVWTNAWDMFFRAPSRVDRGRRDAVDFVVCFGCGGFFLYFFSCFFFFQRTRPAGSMRPPCLIYISTSNEASPRERSDRGRFLPLGKKASSYRGAYRVPLFQWTVCVYVCVTFVVFTDCERELYVADFHKQTRYLWKRASMG